MAKMKRELELTIEETDTLTKASIVLVKILKVLDSEDGMLLGSGDIEYPDILNEMYQNVNDCFY